MKLSLLIFLVAAYSSVLRAEQSSADENQLNSQTITLAALEFPPYAYTESGSSECIGYIVELTELIFVRQGHKLNAICAPAIRVYRMIKAGEVDLTVNVKSTRLIQQNVEFIEPPFGELELIFLSHDKEGFAEMVSGIRGFDYNGQRQVLEQQGFIFQDTPGSIDAIKMFVRGRTRHLITYKAPYKFYLEHNGFEMPDKVTIKSLMKLPTHYAVSTNSDKHGLIKQVLTAHSKRTEVKRFDELLPFY